MKRNISLLIIFALLGISAQAQRGKVMLKPNIFTTLRFDLEEKKIDADIAQRFDPGNKTAFSADEAWIVFSDRSKNPVYESSGTSGKTVGTVEIGDVLYVLEDSGPSLKVAKLNGAPYSNFTFENTAIVIQGWIPKNKLILWDKPLRSKNTMIELKGFLINEGEAVIKKISSKETNKELIELYDSPDSHTKLKEKNLYEVLFVYHYDKDHRRYLLSPSYTISGNKDEVFWVDEDRVKVWNTRLALEWNFNPAAIAERKENLLYRGTVFKSLAKAESYRQGQITKASIDNRDFLQSMDPCCESELSKMVMPNGRYAGEIMRYPYFESENADVLKCGALLRVNMDNSDVLDERNWQGIKLRWKNMIESTERVNVVFVINARRQFGSQASEIGKLVDVCQQKLEAADVKFKGKIKMGAVLYQDVQEIPPVRVFAATSDFNSLKQSLAKAENYFPISDNDTRDLMNLGIKKALAEVCHPDETNIIIVLGSAGDCYSGASLRKQKPIKNFTVPQEELAALINQYNAHLLAIQAFNNANDPKGNSEFGAQIKSILSEVTNHMADEYRDVESVLKTTNQSDPTWVSSHAGTYQLDYITNFKSSFRIYNAPPNATHDLNIQGFSSLVGDFASEVAKKESEVLNSWNELIVDDSKFSDRVVTGGAEIREVLINFSPEERRMLALQKVQLLYNGFTPIHVKDAKNPTYQFVLFMSKFDLEQLNDRIGKIIDESLQPKQQRKAIVKAWYEYASSVLHEPVDKLQQRYKNSIELQRVLKSGLKGFKLEDSSIFSKYTEDQINDEKYVTPAALLEYRKHLEKISEQITALIQDSNMAYRTSNQSKFYWVPIDYLP
jgi:hypothetical protein